MNKRRHQAILVRNEHQKEKKKETLLILSNMKEQIESIIESVESKRIGKEDANDLIAFYGEACALCA
jgi:hypothetical protein